MLICVTLFFLNIYLQKSGESQTVTLVSPVQRRYIFPFLLKIEVYDLPKKRQYLIFIVSLVYIQGNTNNCFRIIEYKS